PGRVSANARSRGPDGGFALLSARGALSRGDRADLRALCVSPARWRGAASRRRVESAAGRQPPHLSRVRDRLGCELGTPGLVDSMSHQALPAIGAVLQAAGMLAVAPLLKVAIKRMKARLQNRQGPPWR